MLHTETDINLMNSVMHPQPCSTQPRPRDIPLFVALLPPRKSFVRGAETRNEVCMIKKSFESLSNKHVRMPLLPRPRHGSGISANSNQEGIAYDWFLKQALLSQVYDLVKETPIQYLPVMSNELNNQIFAKREEMQTGFSFCTRGAHHLLLNLTMKTRVSEHESIARQCPDLSL